MIPSLLPTLGVIVVTYGSGDVILDCLESLLAQEGVRLAVTVVDNGSPDGTPGLVRDWAAGRAPYTPPGDLPVPLTPTPKPLALRGEGEPALAEQGHAVTLIETGVNGGFAAGVNRGLARLAAEPAIDRFWILNPDGFAAPGAAWAFATAPAPAGGFALMGGRLLYLEEGATPAHARIQIDGGLIDRRTGQTRNANQFRPFPGTPAPEPAALDFITGASMVASRAFYEVAGPLPEDYFLYYEEVDWALRRGALPLTVVPDAVVWHRAGTAIGSPAPGRPASPFSLYFKNRGRLRFVRRHVPLALPGAWAYSLAKAAQLRLKGHRAESRAVLAGSLQRPPTPEVSERLSPEALRRLAG